MADKQYEIIFSISFYEPGDMGSVTKFVLEFNDAIKARRYVDDLRKLGFRVSNIVASKNAGTK